MNIKAQAQTETEETGEGSHCNPFGVKLEVEQKSKGVPTDDTHA